MIFWNNILLSPYFKELLHKEREGVSFISICEIIIS